MVLNIPILSIIVLILLNVFSNIVIFQKRYKFPFLAISVVLLNTGILLWQSSLIYIYTINDTLFLHKLAFIAALVAINGAMGLAFTYPDKRFNKKSLFYFISSIILSTVLTALTFSSDLIIKDYLLTTKTVVFGEFGFILNLILISDLLLMIFSFIYRYFTEIKERFYFKYVFIAFIFYGFLALLFNFLLPLLGITRFSLVGSFLAVIPQGAILYTLITERLHSLKYIINVIAYLLLSAVFLLFIYTTAGILTGSFALSRIFELDYFLVYGIISLVVPLIFIRIQKDLTPIILEDITQSGVSGSDFIRKLGKDMSTKLDIMEIGNDIRDYLNNIFYIENILFVVFDEGKLMFSTHTEEDNEVLIDQINDSNRAKYKINQINKIKETDIFLIEKYKIFDYFVIIGTNNKINGILLFGNKIDQSPYTVQDFNILDLFISNISVAITRSLLYSEVLNFNNRLQSEITAATTDLKIRNKRLTILRQLDQIVINTPDVRDMTQKIADLISWEMGFIGASIILLDEDEAGKYLHIVALSDTPTYERALKLLPQPITDYRINWGLDPSNLFYKCINERKAYYTDTFKNMYVPPLTIQQAEDLQKATKTEHTVIYPLSTKGNALGAIAFSVHQQFDELSNDDKELISAFMDEAGIAIENTQLYMKLEKTNQSLINANERLKQLDKMKDELVSVASHELRTPMTAIKSYLWMALNKEAPNLTTNMRRYLERAFISSERMIELVNDMLSASRLEGGRIELDLQAYDLVPIIGDVIDQMLPKAQEKNLDLIFEKPTIDVPLGYIDEARFREIMFNLVGNSVKYTNEGSVKVAVSVNTKPSEDEESAISNRNYIWITISDTGRGIPAEDMPRLFKKFSKLEQGSFAKTAETGGTGLGLYITKGLVELHGGRIWVHSTGDNQGSVFTFSVKVA